MAVGRAEQIIRGVIHRGRRRHTQAHVQLMRAVTVAAIHEGGIITEIHGNIAQRRRALFSNRQKAGAAQRAMEAQIF